MDSLREEDRSINHHGTTMSTGEGSNSIRVRPAGSDLVSRREDVEVDARKRLYEQIEQVCYTIRTPLVKNPSCFFSIFH